MLEALKAVTAIEQQQNPDVVFAEIAAIDHSFTDNINTRGHFRDYEIPVLAHSQLPDDRIIRLKDLTLRVMGNRLVLRCKRLNKQVIPRLGTAYNYTLSNLPLLRFLGDLQYQGLKGNFCFDPELLLPGLNHYPRVSYKNCILHAAKWTWESDVLKAFFGMPNGMDCFLNYANQEGLPRFFVLADQDRELVFDLSCEVSVGYFLCMIKNKTRIVLKEYLFPEDSQAVSDETGRRYASQLVAFLINPKQVYSGLPSGESLIVDGRKARYLPGSDWCYFKVYAHPESLNVLLRDSTLLKLISGFCRIGGIRRWFFVRYSDPHPHLRIRFQAAEDFGVLISSQIRAVVRKYMENDLVTDFLVATYEPELERYGLAGMRRVEAIFQRSSELVLTFHQLGYSSWEETCFAVSSVSLILRDFMPEASDRLAFVSGMAEVVLKSTSRRIQLDRYYRLHRSSLELAAEEPEKHDDVSVLAKLNRFSLQLVKFQSVWRGLPGVEGRALLTDLIHMHLNRLNASGRAELETDTYYLLFKFYRSNLVGAGAVQLAGNL